MCSDVCVCVRSMSQSVRGQAETHSSDWKPAESSGEHADTVPDGDFETEKKPALAEEGVSCRVKETVEEWKVK